MMLTVQYHYVTSKKTDTLLLPNILSDIPLSDLQYRFHKKTLLLAAYNCSVDPTTPEPEVLWVNPVEVAKFKDLELTEIVPF